MVKKGKIALYRGRLDETLASDDLTDAKKLRNLVKHHILQSSDNKTSGWQFFFKFLLVFCVLVANF